MPNGKGKLTGIPTPSGFYVRNVNDFDFNRPYEDCSLKYTSEHVFISEIADPDNNTSEANVRFIE
ncbi:hypothetical protein [Galbibacter sp. PAP.153]|uniref:hypothetical protein n=1 Tax=Galbibacter sp. PAP.153 TaxID=3104623 RepID=UPI00300857E4